MDRNHFDTETPFERNAGIQVNLQSILDDLFVLRDLARSCRLKGSFKT